MASVHVPIPSPVAPSPSTSVAFPLPSTPTEALVESPLPSSALSLHVPPVTSWIPAPDKDLDEAELDLAINGYEPVDNLEDVDLGSDDYELEMVPVHCDEESPSDGEQESALRDNEALGGGSERN
ncbi:hypothetical protein NUW54_g470 [Trametes sanguinea]|uniref:Uncharacterized protein n=1 Tax=Trametes sanguinea TaxID=158606 RepID=A0ACC1QAX8_9APHY|nr:hypothetical protein NUW54_g470 [Trametes sanguinea]